MNFSSKLTQLTVALLVLSVLATPALAAGFNTSEGPNPTYSYDVEKDTHNMSWGTSNADALVYENNDGNQDRLDAKVNESARNPITFTATDIELADLGGLPHAESTSALDASEWTTSGASVSDAETAPGVDAVRVSTSGVSSGTEDTATFSNLSLTSDEEKRFLQLGLDVDELDSGATVEVRVIDEGGDKKIATINNSADPTNAEVVADGTGEGWFFQHRLGDMNTIADGDGNFDNIESIEVAVIDGDADVSISTLNVEKLSQYQLGETMVENSDGEWESETITEVTSAGPISITSLGSMGAAFDSAIIHELTVDTLQTAAQVPSEDVSTDFSEDTNNTYPGYHGTATIEIRNGLVDAYDLSYSNVKLVDTQSLGTDRYLAVEYAEDVGDTNFSDISDSAYSSITTSYTTQGEEVEVDSTIQPGDESVMKYELRLNQDEFAALQQTASSGGFMGSESGGPLSGLINWIVAGVMGIAGLLGMGRYFGGSGSAGA